MARARNFITALGRSRWTGRVACFCAALCALTMSGCALLSGSSSSARSSRGWLTDGSLAISRPVPPINVASSARASLRPDALPEQSARPTATVLRVTRAAGRLSLEGPDSQPLSFSAQVASTLRPGRYTIALKQANPLWYAPASYFKQRDLRVPAEGSRERFKRGALGSQALFLSNQTPIHSGPIGTSEIGGLRISPRDMDELFSLVQVGTVVEVR